MPSRVSERSSPSRAARRSRSAARSLAARFSADQASGSVGAAPGPAGEAARDAFVGPDSRASRISAAAARRAQLRGRRVVVAAEGAQAHGEGGVAAGLLERQRPGPAGLGRGRGDAHAAVMAAHAVAERSVLQRGVLEQVAQAFAAEGAAFGAGRAQRDERGRGSAGGRATGQPVVDGEEAARRGGRGEQGRIAEVERAVGTGEAGQRPPRARRRRGHRALPGHAAVEDAGGDGRNIGLGARRPGPRRGEGQEQRRRPTPHPGSPSRPGRTTSSSARPTRAPGAWA